MLQNLYDNEDFGVPKEKSNAKNVVQLSQTTNRRNWQTRLKKLLLQRRQNTPEDPQCTQKMDEECSYP